MRPRNGLFRTPEVFATFVLTAVCCSLFLAREYQRSYGHRIWHRVRVKAAGTKLELSNDPHEWLVSARHKILMCSIPKNSLSQYLKLFSEATGHETRHTIAKPYPHFDPSRSRDKACEKERDPSTCGFPSGALEAVSRDPAWLKLIVLRDPFERILSAWLDKCANANQVRQRLSARRPKFCRFGRAAEATPQAFHDWLRGLHTRMRALSQGGTGFSPKAGELISDPHVWPQHRVCGLSDGDPWRNYVTKAILMSANGHAEHAVDVLAQAGIDADMSRRYLIDAAADREEHATGAARKVAAFATQGARDMVRWIYAGDYELLRFFEPHRPPQPNGPPLKARVF